MMLSSEADVIKIIEEDVWMMTILRAAKSLHLPDWWICAGFVRSKIWDCLHNFSQRTPLPDIDVIYFDESCIEESMEKELEKELNNIIPHVPWSVKNEARMHRVNGISPYTSSVDAISKFPETATALGVKLDQNDRLLLTYPCGLEDVINMRVKPTSFFIETEEKRAIFNIRMKQKDWIATWNRVEYVCV
ncbi:nucleotidyltransferase family protein [Terrilactibacillus laevilacticus]|uniref:nucleotidyltransferase family protein n=1 Tax=Terrilactibacillus laevilacticus TaxID=1380157 RepID=UPI0015EF476B|nr:nucleotidyltransferase family protein [Terrilactibacillus laevilacticus]